MRKRPTTTCIILLLLGVSAYSSPRLIPEAHSLTSPISAVYVTPVRSCCILPNATSPQVTVNVMMNLTAGQSINAFDIRLNYTNYWTPVQSNGVVQANASLGFNFANNLFSGRSPIISAACIDGIVVYSNAICPTDDAVIGQVHLAQTVSGPSISGPLAAQFLFSVTFSVKGIGSSMFIVDRGHLLNPGTTNPDTSPQFVQDVTGAGIFGNTPIVAFFDYAPQTPPSVLAGDSAILDASSSVGSTKSGPVPLATPRYSWNFGDGSQNVTGSNPLIRHLFLTAGNYTVQISVSDLSTGEAGFFQRVVPVSAVLGGLEVIVKNAHGGGINTIVLVQVRNATLPNAPLCARCSGTINAGGTVEFRGLSPGYYTLTLSGPTVDPRTAQSQVYAGWTAQAWVYMTLKVAPQPDTTVLVILAGVTFIGVALAGLAMFRQRRRRRSEESPGTSTKASRAKKQRFGRR